MYSGVFRISVRRRRCAVGVDGVGCGGGVGPSQKKSPSNDKFGCILMQAENTVTISFGTRILRFNRKTKITKATGIKIIQKFTVRPKLEGG